MSDDEKLRSLKESPLFEVYVLVEAERQRSLGLHRSWDAPEYTATAMHKAVAAELAEVDLAIELGHHTDAVRELVHTANTACKGAHELMRRGSL